MTMNVSRDLLFIFVFITPMLCSSSEVELQLDPLQLIKEGVEPHDLDPLLLSEEDDKAHIAQQNPNYAETAYGKNDCPSGYAGIFDEAECKKAQKATGKKWAGANYWHNIQTGCFSHSNKHVWFNKDPNGRTHGAFSSVCIAVPGCPAGWPQIKDVGEEGTASSAITAQSRGDCAAKCGALSTCGSIKFNADSKACSFNTWAQSTTEETAEEGDAVTCKKVFVEVPYETACPSDMKYAVTDDKACKEAAAALGKKWGLASSWNNIPRGCTSSAGSIYFNLDAGKASKDFSKVCSSSGTDISTKPSSTGTTATTTPSLTSVCTPGVCTKGKWTSHLSGKTEAECKAMCEDGRKYVSVADGIQEDVYYFGQKGRFQDLTGKMSSASRIVNKINYPNTGGHFKEPSGKDWPVRDNFYVRWSGYIQITAAGRYTFNTRSDDGSRVFINDKQVLDNGGWHAMQDKRGSVELSAGKHKFWVEMFEGGGGSGMEWKYSGPDTGSKEVIVPEKVLSSSLTGSATKEFNPEWETLGMCQAYSYGGDQCIIYGSCNELSADKESVICEDNSFDWVEPSTLTTCKY